MPDRDITARFAIIETKVEALTQRFEQHAAEDGRRFDKLDASIDRLTWRLALVVGGISAASALLEFILRGVHT